MHARSAVVDLFGDHLGSRHYWAPIAGVIALGRACGIQPAATRTAVSRLVGQGWLRPAHKGSARGYQATDLAVDRIRNAHRRIYASGPEPWDGSWHLVIVEPPGSRRVRDQVVATLGYLGYGRLSGSTWISPRCPEELSAALSRHGVRWTGFTGPLDRTASAADLASRVWDLDALARAYTEFVSALPGTGGVIDLDPEPAFALRAELVHDWRKFLFVDPGLPAGVLPDRWPGHRARQRFLELSGTLRPAADQFVTEVLGPPPA